VPHNEFLATTREFGDFVLKRQLKLLGTEDFINAGVQFRSQRVPAHYETVSVKVGATRSHATATADRSAFGVQRSALV